MNPPLRAASLALAIVAVAPAHVQTNAAPESRCEQLPQAQRAHCEKVVDCMAIDDSAVRRVCLDAAKPSAQSPEAQAAAPSARAILVEESLGTPPSRPTQVPPQSPPESQPRVPPNSFSAEVTGIYQSILDRQVIALDDSYLFVGEHARRARLKVGQVVEVRRMKSRFRTGRTWRISGPSRSPVEVLRVRCESDDIGNDDRRRCERMLARR